MPFTNLKGDGCASEAKDKRHNSGDILKSWLTKTATYEPCHEISNNVVCATSKGSDQPAHTRRLSIAFAGRLNIL